MTQELQIKFHSIDTDGYPDMGKLVGRVAFIFDGDILSGWPLDNKDREKDVDYPEECDENGLIGGLRVWEAADGKISLHRDSHSAGVDKPPYFAGVTHWLELPATIAELGIDSEFWGNGGYPVGERRVR